MAIAAFPPNMPKRKRLILPYGAAEADAIELQNNMGFAAYYSGQLRPDVAVTLSGNPVVVGIDAFRLRDGRMGALLPYGTPIEIQTV